MLYTGDHVFGDILKSKRQVGWKTFLVVPELLNEIYVWKKKKTLFDRINELDNNLANIYMYEVFYLLVNTSIKNEHTHGKICLINPGSRVNISVVALKKAEMQLPTAVSIYIKVEVALNTKERLSAIVGHRCLKYI